MEKITGMIIIQTKIEASYDLVLRTNRILLLCLGGKYLILMKNETDSIGTFEV